MPFSMASNVFIRLSSSFNVTTTYITQPQNITDSNWKLFQNLNIKKNKIIIFILQDPFTLFFLNEISMNTVWIWHGAKTFRMSFSRNSEQSEPQCNDRCEKGGESRAESAPRDGLHPLTFQKKIFGLKLTSLDTPNRIPTARCSPNKKPQLFCACPVDVVWIYGCL